jgi:hypothetical protein
MMSADHRCCSAPIAAVQLGLFRHEGGAMEFVFTDASLDVRRGDGPLAARHWTLAALVR